MNAVRQVVKVKNHRVTVELPANFTAEEVEVIVLPAATPEPVAADQFVSGKPLTKLQQLLLDAPVMSDEEYEFIMEKRRALNAWK
ncbi:MAG: hypothetical protein H7Y12_08125 [Sphingobacteriaceae bacterium]|nr:hypothetical protein [Cytophagaceae bacterium]